MRLMQASIVAASAEAPPMPGRASRIDREEIRADLKEKREVAVHDPNLSVLLLAVKC
jgi:hypothetical protein